MLEEVHFFIKEKNLIEKNDKILLALSGGPDSIALFHILQTLKKEYSLTIAVAHVNHSLRGVNADTDEDFVRDLAKEFNVDAHIKKIDVNAYAKENSIGLEEAGRKIRYDFFYELVEKHSYDKIALGHNLDDNVETFLFRLMRGTSLEGLNSIPIKRDKIIRPLMCKKKYEILHFLEENNYKFRIDESNFEKLYTRNKIRLDLIPYIEKEFNPNFLTNINYLIEEVNDFNLYIQNQIEELSIGNKLDLTILKKYDSFIRKRVYKEFLKKYEIQMNRTKFDNIDKIIFTGGTKEINLNDNYTLVKEYDFIYIKEKKVEDTRKNKILLEINNKIRYNGYEIQSEIVSSFKLENNTFNFDYDKLNNNFFIRTKENGDKFIPFGMTTHKKLKKFFIDEKIPKEKRDIMPIILSGNEIILVGNLRGTNLFKVDKNTKKILLLKVKEVESNDGQ